MNVRKIVLNALLKTELQGGFSNLTLDSALKALEIPAADKKFASAIFYGVIERKITLDYFISQYSSKKLSKLSPLVLTVLRMGFYQIIYMDKVPDNAAVDESVKLIKSSKEKYASGFVNAVLRSFLRKPMNLPTENTPEALEIKYSCPKWFIRELCDYLGEEKAEKMLHYSLLPSNTYIRRNNILISNEDLFNLLAQAGITVEETSVEDCYKISDFGSIERYDAYKKGYFHVQDMASQISISSLKPQKGDRILDICSAPGGKAFTAAEFMENSGEIIACDLHSHRVKLIEKGAERLKLDIIKALQNDASRYNQDFGLFDKIICDVPCSGFGDIGRKPEIKYKNPADLTNLPELQYNILCVCSEHLRSGGKLMYSTCTLKRAENEDVVERFLDNHKDFVLEEFDAPYHKNGFNHLIPGELNCDGFFFSILKRK